MPALLAEATDGRSTDDPSPAEETISVLIFAKDPISHAGVERQLLAMADITVLTPSAGRHPDVALVVADTVDDEALGWIRTVRQHSLSRIVVVAAVNPQAVAWAIEAGANGVLPRSMADGRRLAWAIKKVHRGDSIALIAPDDRREATSHGAGRRVGASVGNLVSARDREVLRLLSEGCDTGEIARTLAYSEPTIKNVIQRLFEQLKAKNRPHAVAVALRSGII
ncbi:MAG: LuxR C-terminal-related transcriptional regulator [Actinomycetota bacterium]|nr:LuxR C-terminal-related transcriptional regulator [Actinomycetota bacterium]